MGVKVSKTKTADDIPASMEYGTKSVRRFDHNDAVGYDIDDGIEDEADTQQNSALSPETDQLQITPPRALVAEETVCEKVSVEKDVHGVEDNAGAPVVVGSAVSPREGTRAVGGRPWLEVLKSVADQQLWGAGRRDGRPRWAEWLGRAGQCAASPRKQLPKDVVDEILRGDLGDLDLRRIPNVRTKIIVFVSSTFTDTKAERNTLMRDVYPYLRTLCRTLGLDFGSVDMRWGVNEETTFEHGTAEVCVREVQRCTQESAGPAFLAILGHKYGYRPFPAEIEQGEMEKLKNYLVQKDEDVTTIDEYFRLDTNAVPPEYVLRPRTADMANWWQLFERLQQLLRLAAAACLGEKEAAKYFISVTEQEMQHGLVQNEARKSQVTLLARDLSSVRDPKHVHRHIIDVNEGAIDEDAQAHLRELKEVKVVKILDEENLIQTRYDDNDEEAVKEYVRQSCDQICEHLTKSILKNYTEHLHVEVDDTFQEVLQHRATVLDKCSLFVGRDDIIAQVLRNISQRTQKVFALHGRSGCGKTALMAMCAQRARQAHPNAVVVTRFLGTTSRSGSARAMLRSICKQIKRAYGKEGITIPSGYKELLPVFKECLGFGTSGKPLIVFLDSLDQLSNEDFGKNLKWLSLRDDLPENTHITVSTLPGQCLEVLEGFVPAENLLEVKPLNPADGGSILDKMLSSQNRTLTPQQRELVLCAFNNCPLPLYLRLATDIAVRWHSYDDIESDAIASDMPGLITLLFKRLESKYGNRFVHHALAYITAAKNGLSVAELEDILSCDDEILSDIFSYWTPPFRRIPPLLWIRIRNELGMYLVERGAGGVSTYGWYHRQFWETAEERYLKGNSQGDIPPFEDGARQAIAHYFEGKFYHGKEYKPKKSDTSVMENRQIASQPLVLTGDRQHGRKLNTRKLTELSYQLLKLNDWANFKEIVGSLEFMEAKFEADQGYECLSEFIEANKLSNDKAIKSLSKFIGAGLSHLLREPDGIYQLSSQQVVGNHIRQLFDALPSEGLPRAVIVDQNPSKVEDPCEMTMRGHTSGVRCCRYSPSGDLIVSCSEDGSMRVWDAFSGAEVVTVTGLPGPTYPSLADPYHGERPCTFCQEGTRIATGSEDGWLQVWDMAGAQIHGSQSHGGGVTGVSFSPDNTTLATSSKDGTVKFWDVQSDFNLKATVSIGGKEAMCCDYSPNGAKLAVSTYGSGGGLAMVDAQNHTLLSSNGGHVGLNICVCYSPKGDIVATGGSDSSVTLWHANKGNIKGHLKSHKGWIWGVAFNREATIMLTCSSDRTMKMWNMKKQSVLITLGGHTHRVCWASIKPGPQDQFVTCSLDFCLKVWDMDAVGRGEVPAVGGLHYVTMRVSPDRHMAASSQGWSTASSFHDAVSDAGLGTGASHGGFVVNGAYTPDSCKYVSLDPGHGGEYTGDAVYKAAVKVTSLPDCSTVCDSMAGVRGPTAVACTDRLIALGTNDSLLHVMDANTYEEVRCWSFTDRGSIIATEEKHIIWIACAQAQGHVAAAAGRTAKIWDISDASNNVTFVAELDEHDALMTMCLYSPDGGHLVTATISGSVHVWDSSDYSHKHKLLGHVSMIKHMDFSPSGRYLATVAVEMSMRVWDAVEGFGLHAVWYGPINQLGFVKENTLLVAEATGNKKWIELKE